MCNNDDRLDRLKELPYKMDYMWDQYQKTKSFIGFQKYTHKGKKGIISSPEYLKSEVKVFTVRLNPTQNQPLIFEFDIDNVGNCICISQKDIHKLTKVDIEMNNKITLWINQNFIIRLCSLMDSHHLWKKDEIVLDSTLTGCNEVQLVRDLRHKFAHGSGKYKDEYKHIWDKIVNLCDLDDEQIKNWKSYYPEEFPLMSDEVCKPLFKKCYDYVLGYLEKNNMEIPNDKKKNV